MTQREKECVCIFVCVCVCVCDREGKKENGREQEKKKERKSQSSKIKSIFVMYNIKDGTFDVIKIVRTKIMLNTNSEIISTLTISVCFFFSILVRLISFYMHNVKTNLDQWS